MLDREREKESACVCVLAEAVVRMVMSSTWWAVCGGRQPDGFLKEGELRVVEAEGLVHNVWSGLHIHLADSQRLAIFRSEKHLWGK